MLRVAASTLAKRGLSRASQGARSWAVTAPSASSSFHYSARKEEEEEKDGAAVVPAEETKSSNAALYAIPVGVAASVPILQFQWFIPNEETLLASTFVAFCVVAYTQGGEMMSNMFKEEADDMLKAQNEAEDKVIEQLEETVGHMELTKNIVEDYQAVMELTETSYTKLNESGVIKPKHLLKSQMEKCMSIMVQEERNNYEKAKIAMMEEATVAVNDKFATAKELKKSALSAAIERLKSGKASAGGDPVQAEFMKFFANKKEAAGSADDGSEELAARKSVLTKMNSAAEMEEMYFRFDLVTGQPKLVV